MFLIAQCFQPFNPTYDIAEGRLNESNIWWTLELMRHSKPVRLETAPTGGESVYLFLEFTINHIKLTLLTFIFCSW